jgi:hypothetical protein
MLSITPTIIISVVVIKPNIYQNRNDIGRVIVESLKDLFVVLCSKHPNFQMNFISPRYG